jgi:hypothetical protein
VSKNIWAKTSRKKPKKRLTSKQRERLLKNCLSQCQAGFRKAFLGYNPTKDEIEDILQDAAGAMLQCLDRFDTSKRNIGKTNEPGPKSPKTLEFHFINFFQNYINLLKKQDFGHNFSRGITETAVYSLTDEENREMEVEDISKSEPSIEQVKILDEELRKAPAHVRRYHQLRFDLAWKDSEILLDLNGNKAELKKLKAEYKRFHKAVKAKIFSK